MEKLLDQYDKEYMKMAMLKHEETFKEQVHELHRLYRIQKVLMKSIESRMRNGENPLERRNSKNGTNLNQIDPDSDRDRHLEPKSRLVLDLERPADHEEQIAESNEAGGELGIEDESEVELTLGPASYYRRKKAETPMANSDSGVGVGFSSSSTGSTNLMRRTSLRIQQRADATREESDGKKWGLVEVPDSNSAFQNFDVEKKSRQARLEHPPWLFQALGLNMT